RRRRQNTLKLKEENKQLRKTVPTLEQQSQRLRSLSISSSSSTKSSPSPNSKENKRKRKENNNEPISPSKLLLESLSPDARKRATLRMMDQKNQLSKGSITQVRNKFGINLSNQYAPSSTATMTALIYQRIEEFFKQDTVSRISPDKSKHKHGHQIRLRLNNLSNLHQRFEAETGIDIDYTTFTRHVPDYIMKPNHDSWGTCLCMTCLNPELKTDKLRNMTHKHPSIQNIISLISPDLEELVKDATRLNKFKLELSKLKHESFNITYPEWQKIKSDQAKAPISTKVMETSIIERFVTKLSSELDLLASHLIRVRAQFHAAKLAKSQALRAYYNTKNISLHTGYAYTKEECYSFASISDDTNHMSEAAWEKVNINWIFYEAGHGKCIVDGVGASRKRQFDQLVAYSPDNSYQSAKDLMKNLENDTNIRLFMYNTDDIDSIKQQIPSLKTIKGTTRMHELIGKKNGQLYSKDLSCEKEKLLKVTF
ncbi:unnamed protein product, partial [Didymodactylos carnosus]